MDVLDPVGVVVFLAAVAFLGLSLVVTRAVRPAVTVTPIVVFFGAWTVFLGLYLLDPLVSRFTATISPDAALLYIVGFAAFFGGAATPMLAAGRIGGWQTRSVLDSRELGRLLALARVELGVVVVLVGLKVATLVDLYDAPWKVLSLLRKDYVAGELSFPWLTLAIAPLLNVVFATLGLFVAFAWRRVSLDIGAVLALAVLNDATTADKAGMRGVLLLVLTTWLVSAAPNATARSSRQLFPAAVVVIIVSVAVFGMITWFRIPEGYRESRDPLIENTAHLYDSVVGNVVSFSYFVDHPMSPVAPGGRTFAGSYQVAQNVAGWLGVEVDWAPRAFAYDASTYAEVVEFEYNTSTHLAYYYSDFGLPGVVLLSYFFGLVAAMTEVRWARKGGLGAMFCTSLWLTATIASVRGVYYGAAGFWVTLLAMLFQARIARGSGRLRGARGMTGSAADHVQGR